MPNPSRPPLPARALLFAEPVPGARSDRERWFGPQRLPGTAPVAARRTRPDLFQDTLEAPSPSYAAWLAHRVAHALESLDTDRVWTAPRLERLLPRVEALMATPVEDGLTLAEALPQQMEEDVFRRLAATLLPAGRRLEDHPYRRFNAVGHRIGMALLAALEGRRCRRGDDDVPRLILVAVLSGYVGINLKSTASAASELLNRELAPIPPDWLAPGTASEAVPAAAVAAIARNLLDLTRRPSGQFGLESLEAYHREVVEAREPVLLVFFADDYLESLIDMRRFAVMVRRNPRLRVLFVPRHGRYGNDLALEDLPGILAEPALAGFRELAGEGRIRVSPLGPRAGCLDPRDVSARLLAQVDDLGRDRRVIIETKGCRNFEMLRGELPVPWYAAFNCNRALSIRTVGVDGPPVFLRIPPGLRAYDGFARPRIGRSPSYGTAGVRFARMTTCELYRALASPAYGRLRRRWSDEARFHAALTAWSDRRGTTVADVLEDPEILAGFGPDRRQAAPTITPWCGPR